MMLSLKYYYRQARDRNRTEKDGGGFWHAVVLLFGLLFLSKLVMPVDASAIVTVPSGGNKILDNQTVKYYMINNGCVTTRNNVEIRGDGWYTFWGEGANILNNYGATFTVENGSLSFISSPYFMFLTGNIQTGEMKNYGTFNINSGAAVHYKYGTLYNYGGAVLNNSGSLDTREMYSYQFEAASKSIPFRIINQGEIRNNSGGYIESNYMENDAIIENMQGATYANFNDFRILGNGVLINNGLFRNGSSGDSSASLQSTGFILNRGTIQNYGNIESSGITENYGSIKNLSGSELAVSSGATFINMNGGIIETESRVWNAGAFRINEGSELKISAGGVFTNEGYGYGARTYNDGLFSSNGFFQNTGVIENNGKIVFGEASDFNCYYMDYIGQVARGVINNNGTLEFRHDFSFGEDRSGIVNLNASGILNNHATLSVASGYIQNNSGIINNMGSMINSGTINSSNKLENKAGAVFQNSGMLVNNTGASLNNAGSFTNTGAVSGGGTIIQTGGSASNSGSFTQKSINIEGGIFNQVSGSLSAADITNSGSFIFRGGSLSSDSFTNSGVFKGSGSIATGSFSNSGTLAPGESPGTLTVNGNYSQLTDGTLQIELGSTAFDIFRVTGSADLSGILEILLWDGYAPSNGASYGFLTSENGISGIFSSVIGPSGWDWSVSYQDLIGSDGRIDTAILTASAKPVPVPAAAWLFISGIVGLLGLRRRVTK